MAQTVSHETRKRRQIIMTIAKVFENGKSQAVRLPKESRFSDDEDQTEQKRDGLE